MAQKDGIVFSDVDGTLCFHEGVHGILKLRDCSNGKALVQDPDTRTEYMAFDVSATGHSVWLADRTRELCHQVSERFIIVLVTGARPSTVVSRLHALDFADHVILENGGAIFHDGTTPDPEWDAVIDPARKSLALVADSLRALGWRLDDSGRTAALRIRPSDNSGRSEEIQALHREFVLPTDLEFSTNLEYLDILPRAGGKANAVEFMTRRLGFDAASTIGIGDDVNDMGFLSVVGKAYVLGSSFPEVLRFAEQRKWQISKGKRFDGIHEILTAIASTNDGAVDNQTD